MEENDPSIHGGKLFHRTRRAFGWWTACELGGTGTREFTLVSIERIHFSPVFQNEVAADPNTLGWIGFDLPNGLSDWSDRVAKICSRGNGSVDRRCRHEPQHKYFEKRNSAMQPSDLS